MFDFDSALGVSVHGEDLVLAAVSKGFQGYSLRSFGRVENYASLEPAELQAQVRAYTQANRVNRENVILGVPRDQVVVRQLELPLEVEENLRQVVRFQVEKMEPGEEDSSWFDHVVLERNEKSKSITLQIVMAPAARLEAWLKLFRELDLFPAAVRPASLGYHQVFKAHSDGLTADPGLVVDVGEKDLELAVVSGPAICFSERVHLPEAASFPGILEQIDDFVSRLRLNGQGVRKIYLTGRRGDELLEEFQQRFGDCEPLRKGLKVRQENGVAGRPPGLAQALGLAVSGLEKSPFSRLNLIPEEKRETGQRPSFIPTLAMAALLLAMLVAAGTREVFQQERRLEAIEQQLTRLRPEQEKVQAVRGQVENQLNEAKELQQMMNGRQSILLVLKELTEKIPDDAYLQSLSIQNEKANMTGFADSATGLITILQSSAYLRNVEQRYINRDPRSGKERFNFEARVQMAAEGEAP